MAIVDPVLGDVTPMYEYDPGTWGPPEVERFIVPPFGWRNPQAAAPTGAEGRMFPSEVRS